VRVPSQVSNAQAHELRHGHAVVLPVDRLGVPARGGSAVAVRGLLFFSGADTPRCAIYERGIACRAGPPERAYDRAVASLSLRHYWLLMLLLQLQRGYGLSTRDRSPPLRGAVRRPRRHKFAADAEAGRQRRERAGVFS